MFFNSCETEKLAINNEEYIAPKTTTKEIKLLNRSQSENISFQLSSMLGKSLSTSKTSNALDISFGSIDLEEVLEITNEYGVTNYTYRIIPQNPTPNKFYNLVYSKKDKLQKVKILEFAMNEEFKDAYYNKQKAINQFKGTITEIKGALPNAKIQDLVPCSETIYDPAGISSGYYEISKYPSNNLDVGSGGGSTTLPVYGSTATGGGYSSVSGGGWIIVVVLCNGGGGHDGSNPSCNGSFKGSTYMYNPVTQQTIKIYKTNSTQSTQENVPCDPTTGLGILQPSKAELLRSELPLTNTQWQWIKTKPAIAESLFSHLLENDINSLETKAFDLEMINQMILKPSVFTSTTPFVIERNIDDTNLDPCCKAVFTAVKNTTVCDIAQVLAKLNANKSVYDTAIKTEHNYFTNSSGQIVQNTNPANTKWNSPFDYTIYINPDYTGKTKLYRASLIFHELVHAYFLSLFDDFHNANPTNPNVYNNFPYLFDLYVKKSYPTSTNPADIQHQQMATDYVDAIARALQEYQTGIVVPNSSQPNQIYSDLAWAGLNNSPVFDVIFPIGNPNRQRVLNRGACEQNGNTIGAGTLNMQMPIGLPCN